MTLIAMPYAIATTVARAFFYHITTRFNIPKILLTDKGRNFTSKMYSEVCKIQNINQITAVSVIKKLHPIDNQNLHTIISSQEYLDAQQ